MEVQGPKLSATLHYPNLGDGRMKNESLNDLALEMNDPTVGFRGIDQECMRHPIFAAKNGWYPKVRYYRLRLRRDELVPSTGIVKRLISSDCICQVFRRYLWAQAHGLRSLSEFPLQLTPC
jgi:hypothetical protein